MLLPALLAIQDQLGHLPEAALREVARRTQAHLYQLQGLATGYPHFHREPLPETVVGVCHDLTCHLRGSAALHDELKLKLGDKCVKYVSCLGRCDQAPAVLVDQAVPGYQPPDVHLAVSSALGQLRPDNSHKPGHARIERVLTHADIEKIPSLRPGQPFPDTNPVHSNREEWQLDIYRGQNPEDYYQALAQYDRQPNPDGVIEQLDKAALLGMGGPGARAGKKWKDVKKEKSKTKYVVCNADESEPGTFKDREILLHLPHIVLEGVLLACRVVGAQKAFIYFRHEYPEQIARMREAVADAAQRGLCNKKGSPGVVVFVSPGGYICGEQTAMIEALEDHRAEPRNRPPELQTNGLFNEPTLLSNVETFAWAPGIVKNGGEWYAGLGVNGAKGRRLFSISGDVKFPGVYEVPIGITIRQLLEQYANREVIADPLKAFAPSGPSGGFLPRKLPLVLRAPKPGSVLEGFMNRHGIPIPTGTATISYSLDLLDLELDINLFRELNRSLSGSHAGLMLGAGLTVFGPNTNMVTHALAGVEFYRNESCGKCVPCRVGSQKLVDIGTDLLQRRLDANAVKRETAVVNDLSATLKKTTICGLGFVADNPLISVLDLFPEDVRECLGSQASPPPPAAAHPEPQTPASPVPEDEGEYVTILEQGRESESIFARIDDQLIRFTPNTELDYRKPIELTIDGQKVTVPVAAPAEDSHGNFLRDPDGYTIPRPTTIYEAAQQLFGADNPIPILCHQHHLDPVAVCRVCSVQVVNKEGKRDDKLQPACHFPVAEGMQIHTIASPDKRMREAVQAAVRPLVELLAADHLRPESVHYPRPHNELARLAEMLGVRAGTGRFRPRQREADREDRTSPVIHVDLNSCILCNRCVRGCDDVRHNHVIGRTGKGYRTRISFDLGAPMGKSTCVECGECMISCPTDALTLKPARKIAADTWDTPDTNPGRVALPLASEPLPAEDLSHLELFEALPFKFLDWNAHGVRRLRYKSGQRIFREGEQGHTAFILWNGAFRASRQSAGLSVSKSQGASWTSRLQGHYALSLTGMDGPSPNSIGLPSQITRSDGNLPFASGTGTLRYEVKNPAEPLVLLGEMTCLYAQPRSSTLTAESEGAEVLEIRPNVLRMMMRNGPLRERIRDEFRRNALQSHLRGLPLFSRLDEALVSQCLRRLEKGLDFLRVAPGQIIRQEGDDADALYLVRLGFVKESRLAGAEEFILNYIGPAGLFSPIALITGISERAAEKLPSGLLPGKYPANYTALTEVELLRIKLEDFQRELQSNATLRERLVQTCLRLLEEHRDNLAVYAAPTAERSPEVFYAEGLYQAQRMLILDLERCTRCDECTRACANTHGGLTRLLRVGPVHKNFLIATSCRACLNPTCIVGCPVDAIHRTHGKNIVIENWCVGCGSCSSHCPYGVIHMVELPVQGDETRRTAWKATACDLCDTVLPHEHQRRQVSCVHACPHDAAFRVTGREFREIVEHRLPLRLL
jgi:NADH:ubiquinone oxidoreductase subunit F (NADH-binding)/Fe-S-cluster-containing hydrogenase component 2/CRP-like cAMP-binding protein/NADH:ubiquinone oxidoreductase subunit E